MDKHGLRLIEAVEHLHDTTGGGRVTRNSEPQIRIKPQSVEIGAVREGRPIEPRLGGRRMDAAHQTPYRSRCTQGHRPLHQRVL